MNDLWNVTSLSASVRKQNCYWMNVQWRSTSVASAPGLCLGGFGFDPQPSHKILKDGTSQLIFRLPRGIKKIDPGIRTCQHGVGIM